VFGIVILALLGAAVSRITRADIDRF